MEAFLVSMGIVALGEIGDKTQLLALMLAARFRRPVPIVAGILTATLANHTLAGLVGNWVRQIVALDTLRWIVAASFFAVAVWTLVPDKADGLQDQPTSRWGIFGATLVAFFLAEMGDKTQIATVVLAARYEALVAVVLGTTCGMLIADVPAVMIGRAASGRIPLKAVRITAALLFAGFGLYALIEPLLK